MADFLYSLNDSKELPTWSLAEAGLMVLVKRTVLDLAVELINCLAVVEKVLAYIVRIK